MAMISDRGVDALSMRSLAEALGASPMSLYRHVRNKEDLLFGIASLALDRIQLEISEQGDWWVQAGEWMHGLRRQLCAHPAAMPALMQHGLYAPAFLRATNVLLEILLRAGFAGRSAVRACREITWTTLGFVTAEIRGPERATQPSAEGSGPSPYALLDELPVESRAEIAALVPHFMERDMDDVFAATVRHLLAGMAADLESDSTNPSTRVDAGD